MVRFCCFLIVCAIFTMMDYGEGITKFQLKVLLIVWLMSGIHCGAISLYPFHTLIILSITVTPMIDKFTTLMNISDWVDESAQNQKHKDRRVNQPSSPSSGARRISDDRGNSARTSKTELPFAMNAAFSKDLLQKDATSGLVYDTPATQLINSVLSIIVFWYLLT